MTRKVFLLFLTVIKAANFGNRMERFQNHHFANSQNIQPKSGLPYSRGKFDELSWTLEKFRQFQEQMPQQKDLSKYFRKYIAIKLVRKKY